MVFEFIITFILGFICGVNIMGLIAMYELRKK